MKKTFEYQFDFENYKQFEKKEVVLEDYDILIIEGDNSKGKTSALTAIQEAYMGKSLTPEPLRRGAEKGQVEITVKDRNGNPCLVRHTFSKKNQKGSFTLVDSTGNVAKSREEFEAILGKFFPISVQDFFNMAKNIEGRRKIMKDYFLPLIPKKVTDRIAYIEAKIKPNVGTLYTERANINSKLSEYEKLLKNAIVSDEQKEAVENKQGYEDKLKGIKAEKEKLIAEQATSKTATDRIKEANTELKKVDAELISLRNQIEEKEARKIELQKVLDDETEADNRDYAAEIKELNERITKGEGVVKDIAIWENNMQSYESYKKTLEDYNKKSAVINKEMGELAEEKNKLYKETNLPAGIVISEEDFTMQGFEFSEQQLSFSEVALVLIDLLFKISDCNLITMGNAAEFGTKRLMELAKMARKNNRTIVLTRVVDDSDMTIVGLVNPMNDDEPDTHNSSDNGIPVDMPLSSETQPEAPNTPKAEETPSEAAKGAVKEATKKKDDKQKPLKLF